MKNKKLNLSELKVKSFVTDLENGKADTAKGGYSQSLDTRVCTNMPGCGPLATGGTPTCPDND